MRLYGAIGPRVDGDYFAQELASLDRGDFDMIHIRMNSPGGNVFQGMSIVSAILSMNTPVCTQGYANKNDCKKNAIRNGCDIDD